MEKRTHGTKMADSPPKRRKTRGNFAMKSKKVSWPASELPLEIFTLIISYLPRSNIQNMRLVNREFEDKVSAFLFRVVVVPFKPEIYGITPEPTLSGVAGSQTRPSEILQGSVMLQDKGMRVFQGFGRRIVKFAMSFEFDEKKLANPPIKSDQEAITAFWGIYRWPFKKYNRYSQLEGLEQTADETRTMAKALRFVECAKELGLSIDGGLGWLTGPDVNQKVIERGDKVAVFGESRFVPESKPKPPKVRKAFKLGSHSSSGSTDSQYSSLERMLHEAGYQGETLEPSFRMMLETEDAAETIGQVPNSPFSDNMSNTLSLQNFRHIIRTPAFFESTQGDSGPAVGHASVEDHENENQHAITTSKAGKNNTETCSLKPNDLTNAQREMLLEIEWAQRAFMQSYAIAIIDNPLTFQNIEALTIARLPNRQLPTLRREDFWDSLPQLQKLSIAIIPDWRDVVKLPTSWVQDIKLVPSKSVRGIYQILQDHISHRKNIKRLHFEWICGGEEAPGLFARNQHILAAPLVPKAMDMVNRAHLPRLLSLPYVEHLSLKNCWVSPHIMTRFGLSLRKFDLQTLTLDSVSLTAYLPLNIQPTPLIGNAANMQNVHAANQAAPNNLFVNMQVMVAQNGFAPPFHLPPPAAVNNTIPTTLDWLRPPRIGSWANIIDNLTPGITLADIRHARDIGPEPPARDPSKLKKLEFKSCGYVRLPLDFDQTALGPPDIPAPQVNAIAKRISELDSFMMKPQDYALGVIVNHINAFETKTLENAWNLTVGWGRSRSVLLLEALADGISNAGQGRFDGVIEVARNQQ